MPEAKLADGTAGGADSENARRLAEQLRAKLTQDPKQLAEMARERGQQGWPSLSMAG